MPVNISKLKNWELVLKKSIAGLSWIGFSMKQPSKLLCISSQYVTLIDCNTGEIFNCDADYDEIKCIAICDALNNEEINIAGQYGGQLPKETNQNESVLVLTNEKYETSVFIEKNEEKIQIFSDYGYYTCGFSLDGNYFVFAEDAGITILKKS